MPKKVDLIFDSAAHKYSTKDGKIFRSVTTIIHDYEEPFNKEYWAAYKARERGVTKEQILKEWESLNRQSLDRGNKIHDKLESEVDNFYSNSKSCKKLSNAINRNGKVYRVLNINALRNSSIRVLYPKIYKYLVRLIGDGWTLYAELKTYLVELLVAGTIDLIAIKGKRFRIVDWKTNKWKMDFKSGYYKKEWVDGVKVRTNIFVRKLKYMQYPLDMVEECTGSIYTLQLSTYAHIMEEWGYTCEGIDLFHIRDTAIKKNHIEHYKIDYLKSAVIKMLEHSYNSRTNNSNENENNSSKFQGLRIV